MWRNHKKVSFNINQMNKALQPLLYAILIVGGIFIGKYLSNPNLTKGIVGGGNITGIRKVNDVLQYIEDDYVDTINESDLVNSSIEALLQSLDPHSAFIPAEEYASANDGLQGNFEGVGIEFHIQDDSVMVVSVVPGGPSDEVGVHSGDRIVKVNDNDFTGAAMTNDSVMHTLRGPGGTEVKVTIFRRNHGLLNVTIKRGQIPLNSLDASYFLNANTGYIKLSRFGATTYDEFHEALLTLKKGGMQNLVLDLRGNPGGYMDAAVDIADEFLPRGKMIVYTKGRSRPKAEYKATAKGDFETGNVYLLIDEGSASASEIVAGALQDWDRATIIGRRSFGKGLVQEQANLPDGSAIRLTVSRYYTPTGRSIQKPYAHGMEEYNNELYDRYKHGEMLDKDSIHFPDSLKYKTPGGKTVFGGGGIMPDYFVPIDTTTRNDLYEQLLGSGIINDEAYSYVDANRKALEKYIGVREFLKDFVLPETVITNMLHRAEEEKFKFNAADVAASKKQISLLCTALIARQIWRTEGYFRVINEKDKTISRALELIK